MSFCRPSTFLQRPRAPNALEALFSSHVGVSIALRCQGARANGLKAAAGSRSVLLHDLKAEQDGKVLDHSAGLPVSEAFSSPLLQSLFSFWKKPIPRCLSSTALTILRSLSSGVTPIVTSNTRPR